MSYDEEKLREIGRVTHYFTKIGVAVVDLLDDVAVGDSILVRGPTTNFEQVVESMQIEHENVERAGKGQSIGLRVNERVRESDKLFKLVK